MSSSSQSDLLAQLRAAADPAQTCDRALALLEATRSREHIETALAALARDDVSAWLDNRHRATLREKAVFYFEHGDRDRGGLIREQLIRLLAHIGHPDDADLYIQGAGVYHRQPAIDSAQNLRAAALVGLAATDQGLACAYAARLLGEPDTSSYNGEPSLTALNVLASFGHFLPVYQFVRLAGEAFLSEGKGEVIGRALELLGGELPAGLYTELAEHYAELDVPVASMGIITAIIERRIAALYKLLERMIHETRHTELHQYGLVLLAGAREDTFTRMLYRLARISPRRYVPNCIEAVSLAPESEERDTVLAALRRRV